MRPFNVIVLAATLLTVNSAHAERSPFFAEGALAIGSHPNVSEQWNSTTTSADFRVGAGYWLRQRYAGFAQVGLTSQIALEEPGEPGYYNGLTERFRMLPVRIGGKVNLWPRPSWIQVNIVGAASIVRGSHELLSRNIAIASESFMSVGAALGIELNLVKFKAFGLTMSAGYAYQPVDLASNAGFRAQGSTNLGGVEIYIGLVGFIGAHQ